MHLNPGSIFEHIDYLNNIETYISSEENKSKLLRTIYDIVDDGGIDFERIHTTMEALHWEWRDLGVPTIEKMKEDVRNMMFSLFEGKCKLISTGGFTVGYEIYPPKEGEAIDFDEHVRLYVYFAVEEYDSML